MALKYKELWQVEQVFRDVKSLLEIRPIFHQRDETISGHVFCSFLSIVYGKNCKEVLNSPGTILNGIKQDLKAL